MGKFSEGQHVRVLHTDYKDEFPVDSVFKVGSVYGHGVEPEGEHSGLFFLNGEIEPWQPRVGERVRTISGGDSEYIGVEGVIEHDDGAIIMNLLLKLDKPVEKWGDAKIWRSAHNLEPLTTTTAQPATLKIEAGKFYKTRDGRKVGPMSVDGYDLLSAPGFSLKEWYGNGRCYSDLSRTTPKDIIAEWIDEPIAKASNDNAQPKFKVGDRVRVVKHCNYHGSPIPLALPVGSEHTIVKVDDCLSYLGCDTYELSGGGLNFYVAQNLELITSPTTTIVALIENGQPKPSSTPHVHESTGAAEKEAKRLAAKFKGQQFGVFTLTTTHHEPKPVYDHKWQNMAAMGLKIDAIKELRAVAGMGLKPAKDAVEYFLAAA